MDSHVVGIVRREISTRRTFGTGTPDRLTYELRFSSGDYHFCLNSHQFSYTREREYNRNNYYHNVRAGAQEGATCWAGFPVVGRRVIPLDAHFALTHSSRISKLGRYRWGKALSADLRNRFGEAESAPICSRHVLTASPGALHDLPPDGGFLEPSAARVSQEISP
jgi:hypothetical protein